MSDFTKCRHANLALQQGYIDVDRTAQWAARAAKERAARLNAQLPSRIAYRQAFSPRPAPTTPKTVFGRARRALWTALAGWI